MGRFQLGNSYNRGTGYGNTSGWGDGWGDGGTGAGDFSMNMSGRATQYARLRFWLRRR